MKSVAAALVLVASVADVAAPVLIAPAALLAVSAVSTTARAETPDHVVRQQVVRYDDLNLASPAGAAAFRVRLSGAVKAVCGPPADVRDLKETADYQACVAKASRDALSALPEAQQQAAQPSHAG